MSVPCVPMALNLNGNAITVSPALFDALAAVADGDMVSPMATAAALARTESVGAHFRRDAAAYRLQDQSSDSGAKPAETAFSGESVLQSVQGGAAAC